MKISFFSSLVFFPFAFLCFNLTWGNVYTPVDHQKFSQETLKKTFPWVPTKYENQKNKLGYDKNTFKTPKGLRKNVRFWIDIYTKYNSHQGVLHDSENIDFVYEVIDFTSIENNNKLDPFQKERAKKRLVRQRKKHYVKILKKLQKKPARGRRLSAVERKIKKALAHDKRKNKYQLATSKRRLRFQLGQKDHFVKGLYQFGHYKTEVEKIFNKHGLPLELTRLPFVESSYNFLARSQKGASGIWQIMPRTGREYLKVARAVDERNHPFISSTVAAKILKKNYKLLNSWPLAITGYNHGAYGIRRLVKREGTTDLVKLVNHGRKKRFGFASKNFYATFLAALEVEKNASKYFGDVYLGEPLVYKKMRAPTAFSYKRLLSWFAGDSLKTQLYNAHLTSPTRKGRFLIPRRTWIYLPPDKYSLALAELKKVKRLAQKNAQKNKKTKRHKVTRGETLTMIARHYGISIKKILAFNTLKSPDYLRVGQTLLIPSK